MTQPADQPQMNLPGGYRAHRFLGRGAFGEVWLAEAPGGVEVAVKLIPRTLQPGGAEREEAALRLMKSLRHPYLLGLLAFFSLPDRLVIVLELADGNLSQRLDEYRSARQVGIPAAELLGYFHEAAEALDFLHGRKVQHRDIKPDNLLLIGRHVKVADYGLARALHEHSLQTASSAGTPAYMAPEVWSGKISPHSDQYSLAVAYLKLRVDRLPFQAENMAQLFQAHLHESPNLDGLGTGEREVLRCALAKEPPQRYPNCSAFVTALTAAVEQDTVPSPAAGPSKTSVPSSPLLSKEKRSGTLYATLGGASNAIRPALQATQPTGETATERTPLGQKKAPNARRHWWRRGLFAALVFLGLATGMILLISKLRTPDEDAVISPASSGSAALPAASSVKSPATGLGHGEGGALRRPVKNPPAGGLSPPNGSTGRKVSGPSSRY